MVFQVAGRCTNVQLLVFIQSSKSRPTGSPVAHVIISEPSKYSVDKLEAKYELSTNANYIIIIIGPTRQDSEGEVICLLHHFLQQTVQSYVLHNMII